MGGEEGWGGGCGGKGWLGGCGWQWYEMAWVQSRPPTNEVDNEATTSSS